MLLKSSLLRLSTLMILFAILDCEQALVQPSIQFCGGQLADIIQYTCNEYAKEKAADKRNELNSRAKKDTYYDDAVDNSLLLVNPAAAADEQQDFDAVGDSLMEIMEPRLQHHYFQPKKLSFLGALKGQVHKKAFAITNECCYRQCTRNEYLGYCESVHTFIKKV